MDGCHPNLFPTLALRLREQASGLLFCRYDDEGWGFSIISREEYTINSLIHDMKGWTDSRPPPIVDCTWSQWLHLLCSTS